jgi:hypothetical protein
MTKEKKETKCDDLIDALLEKHGISPEAVLGENGLVAQLKIFPRCVEEGRARSGDGQFCAQSHRIGFRGSTAARIHFDRRKDSFVNE